MNDVLLQAVNYQGRQLRRSDGKKKKRQILKATLRLIVREGIRGVRHRAVAKEAGVSLSSTTYYFRDIHVLITDAFMYFASQELKNSQQLERLSREAFNHTRQTGQGKTSEILSSVLTVFVLDHISQQIGQTDRRVLEYAFQNESLHNKTLAEMMITMQEATLDMIKQFFILAGSNTPDSNAHILLACIRHIEYQLLVDKSLSVNDHLVKQTISSLVKKLLTDMS